MEYHNISQRSITVEELICKFDRLPIRYGVEEEEEQVIARFFRALKPEIADIVQLQPYLTFTNVCQLALKVQKQLKAKTKPTMPRTNLVETEVSKGTSGTLPEVVSTQAEPRVRTLLKIKHVVSIFFC